MAQGDAELLMRDVVGEASGVTVHRGLELQVVIPASDLEDAITRGRSLGSMYCSALTASSRAWVDAPGLVVAYEITPGVTRRAFRQWHRDAPLPMGKTPVPESAFGPIHLRLAGLPPEDPSTRLIVMALDFYTGAMRQIEPVLRFMLLWPAAEALDGPLRSRLVQIAPDQRHWGLMALARQRQVDPGLVDRAYELRSDLVHVRPSRPTAEVVEQAQIIGDQLEGLVASALCLALDVPEAQAGLPSSASTGHPVEIVVNAEIEGDPETWNRDRHPQIAARYEIVPVEGSDPPELAFTPTFTVGNCDQAHSPGIAIYGPAGPNAITMGPPSSAKVIRADGQEEAVTPDD
jgi:hypothetical protein